MISKFKSGLLIYLKGVGMGAADVVPGVSGGTIAFITGIYEKLIQSLSNFDLEAVKLLFKGKWRSLSQKVNATFLLTLGFGIFSAILTLAKLLQYLLEHEPIYLWSFFMGLIAASAYVVGQQVRQWNYFVVFMMLIGGVSAFLITEAYEIRMPHTPLYTFIAGGIAIIAMILPGVSGSFLLVIMNKYDYIIGAVSSISDFLKTGLNALFTGDWNTLSVAYGQAQFLTILTFFAGALIGLVSFAKVLNWLFRKYHDYTIAVLTGFLIGSLNKVWPWKQVISYHIDRHGKQVPLQEENIMPRTFDAEVFVALGLMAFGFLLVYLVERFSKAPEST